MARLARLLSLVLLAAMSGGGCSNLYLDAWFGGEAPVGITLVVESPLYPALEPSLTRYVAELEAAGHKARLLRFAGGGHVELRELIWSVGAERDPAFLIGDLPYASYRMDSFGASETFPVDLYYADIDCRWIDADGDGVYDGHGPLRAVKPVSRIAGTVEELVFYFDKLHAYRTGRSPDAGEAFIFKDDDWQAYRRGSGFGLERIYSRVVIYESPLDTRKADYVTRLSSGPASYVYQWVHASPESMFIAIDGGFEAFSLDDIHAAAPQGVFFNLFNCKAARFPAPNLGMRYLTATPYGIAVQGSTKIGGNYFPIEFHRSLARGRTWAQAHADWYNLYGKESDAWFLGMAVFGCPVVRLQGAATRGGVSGARSLPSELPEAFSPEPELFLNLVRFASELDG